MYDVVLIDWGGPSPFGEQQIALRNIASIYLRRGMQGTKVNFTHLLIEGRLTYRGPAVYGMFSGSRFFADFGTINDRPWYCEFLLPTNSELVDIDESVARTTLYMDQNEQLVIEDVDVSQGRASGDNLIPRD